MEIRSKLIIIVLLFLSSVILAVNAASAKIKSDCKVKEQYYNDKERGWYFREKCEEIEKKEKEVKKKEEKIDWAKVADPAYLDALDAEKFRKLMEKVKDEAVYNPSHEKVLAYMKMQDYMRTKSVKFAYIWRDALLQNPQLDMTVKNPGSVYGAHARAEIMGDEKDKIIKEIKDTVGVYFFVSGECPYCHKQNKIVNMLRDRHKIAVRSVSSDYCDPSFRECSVEPFMFEQFQIKATPTLVAVLRDAHDRPTFQPIGTGIITLDEVVERLVFYHRYHQTGKHPEF